MRSYRVLDWMSTPALVVPPTTTLATAQRLMEERHVRRLPVVQDGRLEGIVSWGDLRAAWPSTATTLSIYEWRALLEQATVSECMTRHPITVGPETNLHEATQIMLEHKIGGLPVVAEGRVVGMITESDLMRLLIAEASGAEPDDFEREVRICQHCGTLLRRRTSTPTSAEDTCWRCHYHLHRCGNCRYFDGLGCLLDRADQHTAIPGQHCPSFAYQTSPPAVAPGSTPPSA